MTRKLFYLLFILSLGFQTSCSMFESDKNVSASELEGEISDVDVEVETEDDFSDLEDLEPASETAAQEAAPAGQQNAYGEIEDFNTDLIDSELEQAGVKSSSDGDQTAANNPEMPLDDELDLEVADVTVPATPSGSGGSANNKITNLEYKSFESGGTVVITAEQSFDYQVREEPQFNQTVIEIADIQLPEKFKLPYIAKDFGQPVATINAYQDNGATTARVVIQYKNSTKPSIEKKDNSLLVMNSNTGGGGAETPIMGSGGDEIEADMTVAATASDSPTASGNVAPNRPITLEMDDVEIREVIKLIADEVNINIIMDSSIKGPTSVHLKKVPWEEALNVILRSHSLGYVRQGNVMRIAPQDTLTKEATAFAERITKEDQAKRALANRKVKVFPVNYADVDDLAGKLTPFLTISGQGGAAGGGMTIDLPGRAVGDKRSNSIVVTDYEEVMERIERVIRTLDIPPLQVLLEGKIVEANENFLREFGLQWTSTNSDVGIAGKTGTLVSTVRGDGVPQGAGLFQQLTIGSFDILGEISAILGILEREEKVKVLSSPRVMAMNKEKSIIKQSTQLPITQQTVSNGVVTTSVSFQEAVLSMEVTPQVTFTGDTILDIKVQRDVPGAPNSGGNIAINKREASGKVLVKNGQTMVMGGIYDMNESVAEAGIPWLKDIPVLGYLFKSKKKQLIKNELVIFMTPKIVNSDTIKQMARIEELKGTTTSPGTPTSGENSVPNAPDLDMEIEEL